MRTDRLSFVLQNIVRYISQSLEEKKLLYFGMENLDFTFFDPVSTEAVVQSDPPPHPHSVIWYLMYCRNWKHI